MKHNLEDIEKYFEKASRPMRELLERFSRGEYTMSAAEYHHLRRYLIKGFYNTTSESDKELFQASLERLQDKARVLKETKH